MEKNSTVFVAGTETLIGGAISRALKNHGFHRRLEDLSDVDLADARKVDEFFAKNRPDYVFMAAGKAGGIRANQQYPADLMLDNLHINCNVLQSAYEYNVKKLLYLASSCCYPRDCPQPMTVAMLMTGPLEPTNEAYATAKIAGIKLCQAYVQQHGAKFISVIPANVFGIGDDFRPEDAHVIGALIRRMHEAKIKGEPYVELWGTGAPLREFIFADELADACLFLMDNYDSPVPINAGATSQRFSIEELARLIRNVTAYSGEIRFNTSKPDGMPCKILDSSELARLGWSPKMDFHEALAKTYDYFLEFEERRTEVRHV